MTKKLGDLKRNFDIRGYFDELGVQWWDEGDNVSEGWVNINCCFCSDHANHLGINLESKMFHCWTCDESGDVVKLIRRLEDLSFAKAKLRLEDFQELRLRRKKEEKPKREYKRVLPEGFEPIWKGKEPPQVKRYLKRRKFPYSVCQEWALGYVEQGEYALRLIVPIFHGPDIVSFQAVDTTGEAVQRYLDCPPARARIPNKHIVHGVGKANKKKRAVVVEGVTDQWRMGPGSLCLMGKNYTQQQLAYLLKNLQRDVRITVLLDADAWTKAREFAKQLAWRWETKITVLEKGDPAELSEREIEEIWGW